MKDSVIVDVEKAVENLENRLRATPHIFEVGHQSEASEAREQLDRLRKTARLFMSLPIQRVFGDIDSYHGTTVDDFRLFMRRHHLTFAPRGLPRRKDSLFSTLHGPSRATQQDGSLWESVGEMTRGGFSRHGPTHCVGLPVVLVRGRFRVNCSAQRPGIPRVPG